MIEEIDNNNNAVKLKRKRSSKACDVCHKKKIKCDGNNPCSNCIDAKIPCVFSPRTKKRGPRAGYVGIMEKKLRDMEAFLLEHGINYSSSQQNPELNSNGNNINNDNNSSYNIIDNDNKDIDNLSTETNPIVNSQINANDTISSNGKNINENDLNLSKDLKETETEVIMPLIEIFFKSVNSHMPVIHKLTFLDKLKPFNKVSPLLLNAIYLVSTRYIDDPENYCPESVLLKKIKLLLEENIDEPSMETLQAMIIISVHFSGMSIGSSEWIYSGMAHRMAQLLKYNNEISNIDESYSGSFENEYRKRLWWICYLNDKYVSAFANRPLLISENDTKISLPIDSNIWETIRSDEEYDRHNFTQIYFKSDLPYIPTSIELNLFSREVILGALLGKVLTFKEHQREKINNNFISISDSSDISIFDTSLKNWYRSLPDSISNIDGYLSLDFKTTWLNSFLLIKYYTTLILLHQPVIYKNANTDIEAAINLRNNWFNSHSFDNCMNSVESISRILEIVIRTNDNSIISPFFIFCVFQSCIVILVNIINSKIDSSKNDKNFEKFLAIHLSMLLKIKDRWRIARIYLERFFEICKFFDYNYEYACIANGIDPNPISLSYSQLTFNDTVTDNVIAASNWLNFLTILNNIKNYFNSNNKLNLLNNNIIETSNLSIIEASKNINTINTVSIKNENPEAPINNNDKVNDPQRNDFYYNTSGQHTQDNQDLTIESKPQITIYDNSLKTSELLLTTSQTNSNSSLISISPSDVKSSNISILSNPSLVNNNISLNQNENINQTSSSLTMYSSLSLSESSNLYSHISNNIIPNSDNLSQNNALNLNYLYANPELANTTTQNKDKSLQQDSYYVNEN